MDPSRNEMPDIDIDICQDGRQKVIEYVRNKYGHVAQIITFGTLGGQGGLQGCRPRAGRAAGRNRQAHQADPRHAGHDAEKAMQQSPDLRKLYNEPIHRSSR
jgi:DNA polymerase-3 subunit alpha